MKSSRYRLKNDVVIVLKNERLKIDKNNFCDEYAEIILGNERYNHDYGHNIEVLDKQALKALKERAAQQQQSARSPEDIVIEVEMDEEEVKEVAKVMVMNAKDTISAIRSAEIVEAVDALMVGEERKSVIAAADRKVRSLAS